MFCNRRCYNKHLWENQKFSRKGNGQKSGVRGIRWDKQHGVWLVVFRFKSLEDAKNFRARAKKEI